MAAENETRKTQETEGREDVTTPTESPELEERIGSGAAASLGELAALPGLLTDAHGDGARIAGAPTTTDRRAERQFLTGKAAKLRLPAQPLTPAQLTWRKLKKNRLAIVGGILLIVLYTIGIFAQFLAPYAYDTQDPLATYRPPVHVHWLPKPTVYSMNQGFDEYHDRIFVEDQTRPHRLHFFVQGPKYRFWGIFPTRLHLFGTEDSTRVYLLGTDQFGRDYLSRLFFASQISLSVGLIGIAITFTLGMLVGGISGYYGGRLDDVIMRLCEIIMSVPGFYLLLALAATLPSSFSPVLVYILIIAILSFVGWAGMARIIRGMVLSVREREYVEAARALGVGDFKIIVRHILPSTYTFAIVAATLSIPAYILGEASLSFLGLGIRDPMPSWGNMLSAAQDLNSLEERLWLLTPGLMIFITTLAFNFLGDGLRDALDPKSRD
jgi:peptide/nickel transport system permease protein